MKNAILIVVVGLFLSACKNSTSNTASLVNVQKLFSSEVISIENENITSCYYDKNGPEFQYNRFTKSCINMQGIVGLNVNYIGECGALQNMDLSGKDFSGRSFLGANFSESNLKGTNFNKADLRAADLSYTNWNQTNFLKALYNNESKFPFPDPGKQGFSLLSYESLDSMFIKKMDNWLLSKDKALPSDLRELLELDADYLIYEGKSIYGAITNRKVDFLEFIISRGFQFNHLYNGYAAPIHALILDSDISFFEKWLEIFISNGADVNFRNASGETPLVVAIRRGFNDQKIQILLNRGANPNLTGNNGSGPLEIAVSKNSKYLVELLLRHRANVGICNACSLVEMSYMNSNLEIANLLLEHGADVKTVYNKDSIFDYTDDLEMLEKFVKAGADVHKTKIWNHSNPKTVAFLVSKGLDINDINESNGRSILLYAILNEDRPLVDMALSLNANINLKDFKGNSALGLVTLNPKLRTYYFEKLLKLGANPNETTLVKELHLPIYFLKLVDDNDTKSFILSKIEMLIEYGLDLNTKFDIPLTKYSEDYAQSSVFSDYMLSGAFNESVAELMISKGADVNQFRYRRKTYEGFRKFRLFGSGAYRITYLNDGYYSPDPDKRAELVPLLFSFNFNTSRFNFLMKHGADINIDAKAGMDLFDFSSVSVLPEEQFENIFKLGYRPKLNRARSLTDSVFDYYPNTSDDLRYQPFKNTEVLKRLGYYDFVIDNKDNILFTHLLADALVDTILYTDFIVQGQHDENYSTPPFMDFNKVQPFLTQQSSNAYMYFFVAYNNYQRIRGYDVGGIGLLKLAERVNSKGPINKVGTRAFLEHLKKLVNAKIYDPAKEQALIDPSLPSLMYLAKQVGDKDIIAFFKKYNLE